MGIAADVCLKVDPEEVVKDIDEADVVEGATDRLTEDFVTVCQQGSFSGVTLEHNLFELLHLDKSIARLQLAYKQLEDYIDENYRPDQQDIHGFHDKMKFIEDEITIVKDRYRSYS